MADHDGVLCSGGTRNVFFAQLEFLPFYKKVHFFDHEKNSRQKLALLSSVAWLRLGLEIVQAGAEKKALSSNSSENVSWCCTISRFSWNILNRFPLW